MVSKPYSFQEKKGFWRDTTNKCPSEEKYDVKGLFHEWTLKFSVGVGSTRSRSQIYNQTRFDDSFLFWESRLLIQTLWKTYIKLGEEILYCYRWYDDGKKGRHFLNISEKEGTKSGELFPSADLHGETSTWFRCTLLWGCIPRKEHHLASRECRKDEWM